MTTAAQNAVIRHLQDAYAMEQNVLGMLESLIATSDDPVTKSLLQQHRIETTQHADRVERRLKDLGQGTSAAKTATAVMGGLFKTLLDIVRPEKACKNLRDAFITEHAEIAGYELLERYAAQAGDPRTISVARQNKYEEIEMARRLNQLWDRAVEQDLGKSAPTPTQNDGQKDSRHDGRAASGDGVPSGVSASSRSASSAEADMGLGLHSNPCALTDEPSSAPEEGSGADKSTSVEFAESQRTDESGAPVD